MNNNIIVIEVLVWAYSPFRIKIPFAYLRTKSEFGDIIYPAKQLSNINNIHVLTLFNIFMSPPYATKATITSVLNLLAALCIGVSPF